jgi:hypothetical protein
MIEFTVTKTDRVRFVIFSHKTKTLLTKFFLAHPHKSEYLIIKCKNGEEFAKSSIQSATKAEKEKAGDRKDFNPTAYVTH